MHSFPTQEQMNASVDQPPFWGERVFLWVILCNALFLILTTMAMLCYPGGTFGNPKTIGYSFFENFFSDLGGFSTFAGQPKLVSFILFNAAMILAGTSLILFCLAFPRFFAATRLGKGLTWFGSISGAIAGLCFIGVGLTPFDLYFRAHIACVFWGFRAFAVTAFSYALGIFLQHEYPRQYGFIFLGFGALLICYIFLMAYGPSIHTHSGLVIQATGQKIIAYASILSIMIQAIAAFRLVKSRRGKLHEK